MVSTWDFGVPANKAAWTILSVGGRALDAVEAGARVPEADLSNHTVGRAGYPDRDGHVTLDASIMDEFGNCGAVAAMGPRELVLPDTVRLPRTGISRLIPMGSIVSPVISPIRTCWWR